MFALGILVTTHRRVACRHAGIAQLKDEELKLRVKKQQLELKAQEGQINDQQAEIQQLRRTVEQLEQGGLTRSRQILQVDKD